MPRSKLLSASGVPRYILQAGRDFFAWLYADYKKPERCQLEFWAWAFGLETSSFLDPGNKNTRMIMEDSADWKWLRLQAWLRREVEEVLGAIDTGKPRLFRVTPRLVWQGADHKGRAILRWRPSFPHNPTPKAVLRFFLDELLCDLDRVGAEALVRCRVCSHYLIRVLTRRVNYCSPHCRNKALAGTGTAPHSRGEIHSSRRGQRRKTR
jgi:hypothetical protein